MASAAQSGFGVRLVRSGADVAEITNLVPPSFKNDTDDVTNHQSPARWKEFMATLKDSDDVKIEGNLVLSDAGQLGLIADQADALVHAYSVVFPTAWGASFDFSAIVTEFSPGKFDNKGSTITFTCTLKVSGAVTLNRTLSTGLTTPFFALNPAGTNVPAPSGSAYVFVNNQATGATSVTMTPTAAAGVITVNGAVVTSGAASSAIALGAAGSITDVTIVVQETGKVAKSYVVHVARASA
jgi:predicted secreted protein